MRYLSFALFAAVGLACSREEPVGPGETFVWGPMATVKGRVLSPSGAGLGYATISVTTLHPRPRLTITTARSDIDGNFEFTVTSAEYYVTPGLDTASVQLGTQPLGTNTTQFETVLLRFGPASIGLPSPVLTWFDVRWHGPIE